MLHKQTRRSFMAKLLAVGAMAIMPLKLWARNTEAFAATEADAAIKDILGGKSPVASDDIVLKVPDIAENGAVVPVSVSTTIPNVRTISLVINENPNPLSARFKLQAGALADISTRIKMGQSSDVQAVVETDTAAYVVSKNVKVTIGGCGG